MKQRKDYLDILRALAMLMVIFQHIAPHATGFSTFTLVIKLPLFFTLSGYLFKAEMTPRQLLESRLRRLLLPVTLFALLRMAARSAYAILRHSSVLSVVRQDFLLLIRGETMWFIPCLFLTELLLYAQERGIRNMPGSRWLWRAAATAVCVVVGKLLLRPGHALPWHLAEAFIMTAFAQLGRLLREKDEKLKPDTLLIGIGFLAVYVAMILIEAPFGLAKIVPNTDKWPCIPLNLLTGFVGITGLFLAVRSLPTLRGLSWFGRNTLLFYALHNNVVSVLLLIAKRFLDGVSMDVIWQAVLMTALTIAVCIPVILFINRFLPALAGAKPKKAKA